MLLDIIRFFTFDSEIRRCFLECGPYFANINLSVKWATYRTCTHPVSIGRKQDLQYMRLAIFFVRTNVPACQKHDFSRNLMLNRGTLFDVRWWTEVLYIVWCWMMYSYSKMLNRGTLSDAEQRYIIWSYSRWWTEVLYNVHWLMLNDVLVRCWTEVHYLKLDGEQRYCTMYIVWCWMMYS